MDVPWILVIVVAAIVISLLWQMRNERRLTPEDRLERAALKAERDRHRTEAIYHGDVTNNRE